MNNKQVIYNSFLSMSFDHVVISKRLVFFSFNDMATFLGFFNVQSHPC